MTQLETGVVRLFEPGPGNYTKTVNKVEMLESPALCAPVEFFRAAFGAEVEYLDAGDRAPVLELRVPGFRAGLRPRLFRRRGDLLRRRLRNLLGRRCVRLVLRRRRGCAPRHEQEGGKKGGEAPSHVAQYTTPGSR